jgi:hypothetical protein
LFGKLGGLDASSASTGTVSVRPAADQLQAG